MGILLRETLPDKDEVKEQTDLPALLAYYGITVNGNGMLRCPMHGHDKHPSAKVFANHSFYCYASSCDRNYDCFDLVQKMEGLGFAEAVQWLADRAGVLPPLVRYPHVATGTDTYKGPLPPHFVLSYQSALNEEHRQYLRQERLLHDCTIDRQQIGWRGDWAAYSIPFWRGRPGQSEIDILQYRATKSSPLFYDREWRYRGEQGYYRPSIINRHLINPELVIVLFGTFDALLAMQDGLPAISTNGASVFGSPERPESRALKALLAGTRHILVVPDREASEYDRAQKLADFLGGEVRYFPADLQGKDYTDFRRAGGTACAFWKEILLMEPTLMLGEHRSSYNGLLQCVAEGNADKAKEVLLIIGIYGATASAADFDRQDVYRHTLEAVRRDLLVMAGLREWEQDPAFTGGLAHEDWLLIDGELQQCQTVGELGNLIDRWAGEADRRMGGF